MSLLIKGGDSDRQLPKPGLHNAICCDAYDAGADDTPWGVKQKVALAFELDEIHPEFNNPHRVTKRYTMSLHEKSNLSSDLESWFGRSISPEKRKEGIDLETLVGRPCQLVIVHNTDNQGRDWANISTIIPADPNKPIQLSGSYTRVKDRQDDKGKQSRDVYGGGDGANQPVYQQQPAQQQQQFQQPTTGQAPQNQPLTAGQYTGAPPPAQQQFQQPVAQPAPAGTFPEDDLPF